MCKLPHLRYLLTVHLSTILTYIYISKRKKFKGVLFINLWNYYSKYIKQVLTLISNNVRMSI